MADYTVETVDNIVVPVTADRLVVEAGALLATSDSGQVRAVFAADRWSHAGIVDSTDLPAAPSP